MFLEERKLVHYCFQEKETGLLLFSGEGNMSSIVLRRREHVHYCYQEKETAALLFQEKGSGALLFQEKGSGTLNSNVLRRRKMVHYRQ